MVAISDDLAALLETKRGQAGYPSVEAALEADASGPAEIWDAAAARSEVRRRHTAHKEA